jgi:hypothetical protein
MEKLNNEQKNFILMFLKNDLEKNPLVKKVYDKE